MQNRNWLHWAESLMLVGSGVGTVATAASQQVLYAAAPLSVLMLLNLANHRRLEKAAEDLTETSLAKLDEKLSGKIRQIQHQMQAMPSAMHLANLRQDLQVKNQATFEELAQTVQELQGAMGDPNWQLLPQAVAQLQENYAIAADAIAGVQESLRRLGDSSPESIHPDLEQVRTDLSQLRQSLQTLNSEQRLNQYRLLQDQINHLNRRLNNMPAPGNASAVKQDVESLIKVVGEMASRRDLAKVEAQFERLSLQNVALEQSVMPMKMASTILKKQVDVLANKVTGLELSIPEVEANGAGISLDAVLNSEALQSLQATVHQIEQQLAQTPAANAIPGEAISPGAIAELRADLQTLLNPQLEALQQQLEAVREQTQDLDREQKTLREWVHHLPQLLDTSALQNEVKYLANRVEWAESSVVDMQMQMDSQAAPSYEWVFDIQTGSSSKGNGVTGHPTTAGSAFTAGPATGAPTSLTAPITDAAGILTTVQPVALPAMQSRTILEDALEAAHGRLVIVHPMPSADLFDDAMLQQFRRFLDRRGCLDLGLGRLDEAQTMQMPLSIERRRSADLASGFLRQVLLQLSELKRQYPNQFRFKVLGTEESFVVCDRAYAILGTQTVATASTLFPQAVAGLKTTNPAIIQRLVERFDHPTIPEADQAAYVNRAASRYWLGDRAGAIADYTQVIALQPNDTAYNNRALAHYDLGDRGAAMADLDAAVQCNPHNYIAFCNRGYLRSEQGDKLGAIDDYTCALQLNPDYSTAYFYRGLARTRMQNRLGAIQDYTQVLRLNPDDGSAHFYRGLACAKLGQRMEAVRDLRQAAQLFSEQGKTANYQQAISAIKKLQKLMVIGGSGKGTAQPSTPKMGLANR
jgi:tetratricopeptide (TPR) repeat protein